MTQSINFRVGRIKEQASKETLSDIDQTKRDTLFFGDSIEKKELKAALDEEKRNRRDRRIQRKVEKREAAIREQELENRIKKGTGTPEKAIRSEAFGKENKVLDPYRKRYQNVDENIIACKKPPNPYQLVHEGDQFRHEQPQVSSQQLVLARVMIMV